MASQYGSDVTKRDIFHYVYAILHHKGYLEYFAENLKLELPRIPLVKQRNTFDECVHIGKRLMEIHVNYEQAQEYPLTHVEKRNVPLNWRVKKMRLTPDKNAIRVNEWLTLTGIPSQCFQYQLGVRSALEWVVNQFAIHKYERSGILFDPNKSDDEQYIVSLIGKVVTVSIETVKLINQLNQTVPITDWMDAKEE